MQEPPRTASPTRLVRLDLDAIRASLQAVFGPDVVWVGPSGQSGPADPDAVAALAVREEEAVLFLRQAAAVAEGIPAARLSALGGCSVERIGGRPGCAPVFVGTLAERLFRRPVGPTERARLLRLFDEVAALAPADPVRPYRAVVQALLVSPHFVYRSELGPAEPRTPGAIVRLTDGEVAAWLAFGLTGLPPGPSAALDDLLDAPAAERRWQRFLTTWLELPDLATVDRDPELFAAFDAGVRSRMQAEAADFLARQGSLGRTLADLLLGPAETPDPALARFYQDPALPSAGARVGVLALGALLVARSRFSDSSPVRRGLFIRERLLCQDLAAPPGPISTPQATIPDAGAVPEPVTGRAALERHLLEPACRACHQYIDPLGLPFESFDAIARWRSLEAGGPVDTRGALLATDVDRPIADHAELARALAASAQVRRCLATHALRFYLGRFETAQDEALLDRASAVLGQGGSFRDLLRVLFSEPALLWRQRP